ncbi:unnamed protein product [Polarella glacialis]|uniref:Uncharacterized protein n=1 Tax=Polarella glacialis TaxID=89957 RepID=A0A813IAI1_POLGL|nr:unnamed protein product [Polarella glacialis]CAE8647387.1 unnamed protein product [Polarella glacialis]
MDTVASFLRGGVASARGARRVVVRRSFETIYDLKERWFGVYDQLASVLKCERRRAAERVRNFAHASVPMSFRYESCARDALRHTEERRRPYNFTELQKGHDSDEEDETSCR